MAGYYDPKKDYAAAIKNATSDAERNSLISERQNKIDAMNASGTNTKGYTNSIYTGTTVSSGNRNSGASGGYYDPNKDYAAAIQNAATQTEKEQLIAERQNKINAMNAAGTNTGGYTNDIYKDKNGQIDYSVQAKGQYQSQDANIWKGNAEQAAKPSGFEQTALQAYQKQEAPEESAELPEYVQTAAGETDPMQMAAMQAYFTRQAGTAAAKDQMGVYAGDESLSLPDQQKIRELQALWNQGRAEGNQAMMDAAQKQAESIRDDYRYYPLANTDGYGLGENKLGYIRDIVVRVDSLGNRYVDEYGLNNVTTTRYNADGTKSWSNQRPIGAHDDYVARQMDRSAEYGNDWTAIRVADAADAQLGIAELMAKYGAEGGEGGALYTDARINGKIANGKTLADIQAEQGIMPTGAGNGTQAGAYGYFDPSLDYAALIAAETDPTRRAQLMQERQNKINYLNGTGTNTGGYTNAIYGVTATAPVTQEAVLPEYLGLSADEINAQYNDIAGQLAAQRQNYLDLALQQSQAAQNDANANYDNIARQAYILKRQQEQALPQQLSALGISGGGSETANLRLQTNYQNNLAQNELARQQALKDYALQDLAAQTQAGSDIAGYYADAKANALNAIQNQQAQQNAYNQWLAEYQQGLKEYQNALTQQAYENNLEASRYNYDRQLAEAELAAQMGDYSRLAALGYDTSALVAEQAAKASRSSRSSSGSSYSGSSYDAAADVTEDLPTGNEMGDGWIVISGLGKVTADEVDDMMANGTLKKVTMNGKKYYMKA